MTRAERRNRRERVIRRRLSIIRSRGQTPETWTWAFDRPGRFAKFNLKCGCPMCKRPRYKRERFAPNTLD